MHSLAICSTLLVVALESCHAQQMPTITGQQTNIPERGQCPGGPSLPIHCDPKRPWPACPPQSYCYATNTVDVGPYFCCPVWSTYEALWRPTGPAYNYVPPMPDNWPEVIKQNTNWPTGSVSMPSGQYGGNQAAGQVQQGQQVQQVPQVQQQQQFPQQQQQFPQQQQQNIYGGQQQQYPYGGQRKRSVDNADPIMGTAESRA